MLHLGRSSREREKDAEEQEFLGDEERVRKCGDGPMEVVGFYDEEGESNDKLNMEKKEGIQERETEKNNGNILNKWLKKENLSKIFKRRSWWERVKISVNKKGKKGKSKNNKKRRN